MSNNRYPEKKNKDKTYTIASVAILILLIIAAALYFFLGCSDSPSDLSNETIAGSSIVYDDNVVESGWNEAATTEYLFGLFIFLYYLFEHKNAPILLK